MRNERLTRLRKERYPSQEEVAKLLGVDRTTYGKYENGGIRPPYDMLMKLSELFNVSADYILGIDKPPNGGFYNFENITGSAVVNGHNSGQITVTNDSKGESRVLSKEEQEILRIYSMLDVKSRLIMLDGILKVEEEFIKRQNG